MNGSDLKNNLDNEINKANAKDCSLYLQCDEKTGYLLFDGLLNLKLNFPYEKEIQFYLNTDSYRFNGWKVYDEKDKEYSGLINFTDTSTETEKRQGVYKTKITAVKEFHNYKIKPSCTIIPGIYSANIENTYLTYPQDTNIRIVFNTEINPEYFTNSDGTFKNLVIRNSNTNEDLSSYYSTPFIENDNKTLVIPTVKGKHLIEDCNKNKTEIISVILQLADIKDAFGNQIFENNVSYSFTISGFVDNKNPTVTSPLKVSVFKDATVASENELALSESFSEYTSAELDSNLQRQNVLRNHAKKEIYFSVGLEDEGIGIEKISVEEKITATLTGSKLNVAPAEDSVIQIKDYFFSGESKVEVSQCHKIITTEACILQLNFAAYDFSGNKTLLGSYEVVNDPSQLTVSLFQTGSTGLYTDLEKEITYFMYINNSTYLTVNGTSYSNSNWTSEEAGEINYNYDLSVSSVQFSTDRINWKEGGNLKNYHAKYNSSYEICATAEWKRDSTKDLYIKAVVRDNRGNLYTTTEKISENIKIKSLISEGAAFYPVFDKVVENYCSVVYKNTSSESFLVCGGSYIGTGTRYNLAISSDIVYPTEISEGTEFYVLPFVKNPNSILQSKFPYSADSIFNTKTISLFEFGNASESETIEYYSLAGSLGEAFVYKNTSAALDSSVVPDIDQIIIDVIADGVNTGTATVTVSFTDDFIKNEDFNYYYRYKKTVDSQFTISTSPEFKIASQELYSVGVYAVSNTEGSLSSREKTVYSDFDNYQPYHKEAKVVTEYSDRVTLEITKTSQTGAVHPSEIEDEIIYFFANFANNDFTDEAIEEINTTKYAAKKLSSGKFDFYYDNKFFNYLFVKIKDKNGNYKYAYFEIGKKDTYANNNIQTVKYSSENIEYSVVKNNSSSSELEQDAVYTFNVLKNSETESNVNYIFEKFNSETKEWELDDTEETQSLCKEFTHKDNQSFPWIRIYSFTESDSTSKLFNNTSYLYPEYTLSGKTSCGIKNLVSGKAGITVLCSDVVFVHTMYCQTNFGDNISEWETKAMETGCMQSFESFNYDVPLSDIPEDFYYTVIVHFADGTTVNTNSELVVK